MCRECRQSPEGLAIWEEYQAARSAAMGVTGGSHDAAAILKRYNAAYVAFLAHHDSFIKEGIIEGMKRGGRITIFACGRGNKKKGD